MKKTWKSITFVLFLVVVSLAAMGKSDRLTVLADETGTYDIPRITIHTADGNGRKLVKGTGYVKADISVLDVDGKEISEPGQVKVRGNSTSVLPKKPYTIKFDTKQDVLGMGKAKKWILLANYLDKSFLRNYLAFSLADQLNLQYTSSCAFVDVYMDGTYLGNYLLTEQVEEGKSRVDIDSANGDFLLEYEANRIEPDDVYVWSPVYNYRFILQEPEEATEEQLTAVSNVLKAVDLAISTNDMTEIAKVIDVESFVDFYVFNEFIKTTDFGFSSTRFYYKDGILYAGPAWDYDQSMGNAPGEYGDGREQSSGIWCGSIWYAQLMQNDQFQNMCINRFIELQDTFKGLYEENGFVDQAYARYQAAFERDSSLAGWSQKGGFVSSVTTLDGQIAFLKNWLKARNEWLYSYWNCDSISVNYTGYYCAVELTRGLTAQNFSNYDAVRTAKNVDFVTGSVTQEDIDAATAQLLEAVRNGELTEPEQEEIHRLVHVEKEVAPSCTKIGYAEGWWYCGDCGRFFTGEDAPESITESEAVLPALGHRFLTYVSDGNATYEADGTKTAKCIRCNVTDAVQDVGSMLVNPAVGVLPVLGITAAAGETTSAASTTGAGIAEKDTSATITKIIGDSNKLRITGSMIQQVVKDAGTDSVEVTVIAKDTDGKTKYKIKVNAADLTAGNKLVAYRLNTKTGEYIVVNDKSYTVSDKGTVSITMTENRTYELVTEKKAKSINKAIRATIKPAKSTVAVKKGGTVTIRMSDKLNTANVKSITYTSGKKSVATVGKRGKVTAKKAGTTTIKIKVTLKNGTSKTVKTVVKVTSK